MNKRRSFIQPDVQRELHSIRPEEVFRGISEFNPQNVGRLSGSMGNNTSRALFKPTARTSSNIPTPSTGQRPGSSRNMMSGPSSARNMMNGPSSTRNMMSGPSSARNMARGASSYSAGRQARPISSGGAGRGRGAVTGTSKPIQPPPPPFNLRKDMHLSNLTLNSTRRKSKSYDSLLGMTTPFTPARSRSKSPSMSTSRRGISNDRGDQQKLITIAKDKKTIREMAELVYEFLDVHGCHAKPKQFKDLMIPVQITGANFIVITKFVLSHFVGGDYFGKKEDDCDKILEVAKLLKYPATLTKSYIKTSNSQHAWPTCLTFLAWLCCRADSLLTPPVERSTVFQLSTNGFTEVAYQSYLTLFSHFLRGNMTDEVVDRELDDFRERVCDMHTVDVTKTKEELERERDEKQEELNQLINEVDPGKEMEERLDTELQFLATLDKKVQQANNLYEQYNDFNRITIEMERIEYEMKAKSKEQNRLAQLVRSQTFSQQDAMKMLAETSNLKKQLESIQAINLRLKMEIEKRSQILANAEKKFLDACKSFSVIEQFNEIVGGIGRPDLVLPRNPFSVQKMKGWLKDCSDILQQSETAIVEMNKGISLALTQQSKEENEIQDEIRKLEREREKYKSDIKEVEKETDFVANESKIVLEAELEKVNLAKVEFHKAKDEFLIAQRRVETFTTALDEWKQGLEPYKKELKVWEEKFGKKAAKNLLNEQRAVEFVANFTTQALQQHRDFHLEHFGIDVIPALGKQPENKK